METQRRAAGQQSDADRLRSRAVWLYHVEGHTQNDIAIQLGISRVMVIRLLADAKRRNEVRITISSPFTEGVQLEREVEKKYVISRVIYSGGASAMARPLLAQASACV